MTIGGRVMPNLSYQDAHTAIEWLCDTFGFTAKMVVPGEDGGVVHAQLVIGNALVMVASEQRDEPIGEFMTVPEKVGGKITGGFYLVINDDIDDHYEHSVSKGAKVIMENADQTHGGRGYTCLDPEGHLWSFGYYDPWSEES
jgi:uncharacterized glyoxalase superfamily protein PhnB